VTRRPKPTKGQQRASEALFRPLAYPTRESWDAYLEAKRLGVSDHGAESVAGELSTPTGEEAE